MPEVLVKRGSEQFSCTLDAADSLLDGLLRSGLDVNYSCKRGDCNQCIVQLESGAVHPIDSQKPCVSESGIYLCNAELGSDLQIRLPYWPQLDGIKALRSPAKIHLIQQLSADVLSITLRLPPAVRFRFLPGQHVRVTNAEQVTRSYSLAEPPQTDGMLHLHVRTVVGGRFSDYLISDAKPGDLWQIEGPLGHFFLRDEKVASTIFLATGTGIAPIHAVLKGLNLSQREKLGMVSVYCGNRHRHDAYLDKPMNELARQWDFSYVSLASREPLPGHALHVQDQMVLDLKSRVSGLLNSAYVYGCGNPAMLDAAMEACNAMGLPPGNFVADSFTAS